MSDLVERQAVIEINRSYHGQMPNEVNHRIWKEINELPSVQSEIIHCRDCEWWEKQEKTLQGRCCLMQMYPTGAWFCGNAQKKVDADMREDQNGQTE